MLHIKQQIDDLINSFDNFDIYGPDFNYLNDYVCDTNDE